MTIPPRDPDPLPGPFPYGPAIPPDPDTEYAPAQASPPEPEPMPVNLAEFVPDDGSRRVQRTIGTLKVMSVIALVGGAVGMLGAVLRRDLGDIELAAFVSISIVLLIVACAFPVALLVLGRRHRHREATRSVAGSATVWGVICVSLGVLAVGPALGNSVVGAIEDAAVRSSSPTPAETEFTPDEVRAQAESLLTDLAAVAGGAVPDTLLPGEDAPGLRSEPCQLSNLGPGVIISSSGDRYDTPGDPLAALDAVEAYWRDAGYEPRRSGGDTTVDRIHPQVRVSGGAIERVGVYATDDIGYNLIIEYESICVAE